MRLLGLMLGLVILPAATAATGAAPADALLKREIAKCAAAWERADYAAILAYLPASVIRQSGGRAGALRDLKDQFARARELGVEQMEAIPGPPAPSRQIGRWRTNLIPLTAVLHGAHLDLTQRTHVLGMSADQGRHWSFVLLYQVTQSELNAWFPEFAGKVIVPVNPAPSMTVVF